MAKALFSNLRIWGSWVRILSGAPPFRNKSANTIVPATDVAGGMIVVIVVE
jgi:hypothetical protein